MKEPVALVVAAAAALASVVAQADGTRLSFTNKVWTHAHQASGQVSEIPAYDARTRTLWVAGVVGVDVIDVDSGKLVEHLDTSTYGQINSVAIHDGLAALAIESTTRALPGVVVFYDTRTRKPARGNPVVQVGPLPDMLAFTPDGERVLVANEGTPDTYGSRQGDSVPRVYGAAPNDPPGSVSIIDARRRVLLRNAGFDGVPETGSHLRKGTGMDFEPEYVAVDKEGRKAYVTLQEANAIGVLDLRSRKFEKVIGLGAKDFSLPGNQLDPLNNGTVNFISPAPPVDPEIEGLYMPDSIATYTWRGRTLLVTANEGDFREDDGDRSAASSLGAVAPFNALRISNTDSSPGKLFTAGARSFTIRDERGNVIYDSGDILDKEAAARLVYDDGRSRDKGVEPEGLALARIAGRTYAFVGLERTTQGAVAVFDVTNPYAVRFLDMIVTPDDLAPEGLTAFRDRGNWYLAIANEVSNTTTLYRLTDRRPGRDYDDDRDDDDRGHDR